MRLLLALACFAMACAQSAPAPRAQLGIAPAEGAVGETTLEGELVVRAVDETRKSVDAYLGRKYELVTHERRIAVRASSTIDEATIQKLAGRRVRMRGTLQPGGPPNAYEQAPLDQSGRPLDRPDCLVVNAIDVL